MQHRRIRITPSAGLGPPTLVGLGLGLIAGFVLGELFGGRVGRQSVRRAIDRVRGPIAARPLSIGLLDELKQGLTEALGPDAATLQLGSAGRHTVELRGWVTDRAGRRRATQLVRQSLPAGIGLVDRLLVLGEDDRPIPEAPLRYEPEPG